MNFEFMSKLVKFIFLLLLYSFWWNKETIFYEQITSKKTTVFSFLRQINIFYNLIYFFYNFANVLLIAIIEGIKNFISTCKYFFYIRKYYNVFCENIKLQFEKIINYFFYHLTEIIIYSDQDLHLKLLKPWSVIKNKLLNYSNNHLLHINKRRFGFRKVRFFTRREIKRKYSDKSFLKIFYLLYYRITGRFFNFIFNVFDFIINNFAFFILSFIFKDRKPSFKFPHINLFWENYIYKIVHKVFNENIYSISKFLIYQLAIQTSTDDNFIEIADTLLLFYYYFFKKIRRYKKIQNNIIKFFGLSKLTLILFYFVNAVYDFLIFEEIINPNSFTFPLIYKKNKKKTYKKQKPLVKKSTKKEKKIRKNDKNKK